MSYNKQVLIGFLLMVLWSLTTAFSQVLTGSVNQHFPVTTLCFYIFTLTTAIFSIVNFKKLPELFIKCIKHKKDVMLMNITTLGCWFLLIYPLKYIEPSIVGALYLGLAPIVTLFAGKFLYKNQKITSFDYISTAALFLAIFFLATLCLGEHSALNKVYSVDKTLFALSCIVSGGIALGFNSLYTKRMSLAKFSPIDILTVRFSLLIIVTGLSQFYIDNKPAITLVNIRDVLLIAIGMIIVPQLLFQNSIRRIDPISISIIALLMPVLAFFVEFADHRLHPNMWTIIGVTLVFIIATISAVMRYRTETI